MLIKNGKDQKQFHLLGLSKHSDFSKPSLSFRIFFFSRILGEEGIVLHKYLRSNMLTQPETCSCCKFAQLGILFPIRHHSSLPQSVARLAGGSQEQSWWEGKGGPSRNWWQQVTGFLGSVWTAYFLNQSWPSQALFYDSYGAGIQDLKIGACPLLPCAKQPTPSGEKTALFIIWAGILEHGNVLICYFCISIMSHV